MNSLTDATDFQPEEGELGITSIISHVLAFFTASGSIVNECMNVPQWHLSQTALHRLAL